MKIIPIAFTSRELSDFSSVLDLVVSRLSKPWDLVDSEAIADFRIISIHGPEEFSLLIENVPDLDRIIVYSDGRFPVQARWTLTKRENSPPRVSELITLLQQIEKQHLQDMASSDDVPSPPDERPKESMVLDAEYASDPYEAGDQPASEFFGMEEEPGPDRPVAEEQSIFHGMAEGLPEGVAAVEGLAERAAENANEGETENPAQNLIDFEQAPPTDWLKTALSTASSTTLPELLQQMLRDQSARILSLADDCQILVSPRKKRCHFSGDGLASALSPFAERPERVSVKSKTLTLKRLQTHAQRLRLNSAPLSELLWFAALIGSQATPLLGSFVEAPMRLVSTATLEDLPAFRQFAPLAETWRSDFLRLAEAAEQAGAPLGKAVAFYNAAQLLQLFELQSKATAVSSKTSASQSAPSWRERLIRIFSPRREYDRSNSRMAFFQNSSGRAIGKK